MLQRVRAKFNVGHILKDSAGQTYIKLWAVYKGDESSPENESCSNSTPSGNVELCVTNPAAVEFFEALAGKYVYLDFTDATPVPVPAEPVVESNPGDPGQPVVQTPNEGE